MTRLEPVYSEGAEHTGLDLRLRDKATGKITDWHLEVERPSRQMETLAIRYFHDAALGDPA